MMKMMIAGVSLAAMVPALAHAQDAAAPAKAAADGQPAAASTTDADSGVGDIIVTAQKRAQNLQDVPISVAALTSEALAQAGVSNLDSVQRLVPGLSMSSIGSGFVSYTYIRGAGTNDAGGGSEPSVAFFVDEIYLGGATGLQFDLFDIERIEVLKGPQGTLFGRNAAGGAISVVSKRPSSRPEYKAMVEVGNYDQIMGRASFSGPLSSDGTWRYRLTASGRHRGAFTDNPAGRDPGYLNSYGGRAQVEYDDGTADILLTGEYFRARNGMTNQFPSTQNTSGFIGADGAALLPTDQSFFRRYYNYEGFERQRQILLSARAEWDLGPAQLTSITAYRDNRFNRSQDQDGSLADAWVVNTFEHTRQFSQELRLSGQSGGLDWIGGLYYYHSRIGRFDESRPGPTFATVALRGRSGSDTANLFTNSYAAFGQATYHFTDQLALTLGGRYTRDDKRAPRTVDRFQLAGDQNQYTINPKASFQSFDPAITLEFKPADNVLLYGSYKEGYKSGGWQTLALKDFELIPFQPEHVLAWEAGIKSELLDKRLRLNVAGFYVTIKNQQVLRVPVVGVQIVDNAGETENYGADFSLSIAPTSRLHFDLNATLQHARFTKYESLGQNFVGNQQLRSPDFSGSAAAEYRLPVGSFGDLTFRVDYFRQSKMFFDAFNTSSLNGFQPAYGILNGWIGLQPEGKSWELSAWIKNATDTRYFRNIGIIGPTGLGVPGDPLTFGATMRVNFD